jgi:hypothetical protein
LNRLVLIQLSLSLFLPVYVWHQHRDAISGEILVFIKTAPDDA